MKTNDLEQQTLAFLEAPSGRQHETDRQTTFITNKTVTMPPYHISIAPLKAINHVISNNIKSTTFIEIEGNLFLAIEQLDLVLKPMLQKLWHRIAKVYMVVIWNPGGQTVKLKRNTTISYVGASDYMEKSHGPMRKSRKND